MQEVNLRNSSVVSDETRCQRHQTLSANWAKMTQRTHGRANHVSTCMCCHRAKLITKIIQRIKYQTSRVLFIIHSSYHSWHGPCRDGNCTCLNKLHHQLCMIRLYRLWATLLTSAVIRLVPWPTTFKIWKLVVLSGNFEHRNFTTWNKSCN